MLDAMQPSPVPPPLPDVVLYGKPGCHLCEDARATLDALMARRARSGLAVARIVERDITTDDAWERDFFLTIPVVEVGGRRLELATSAAKIRALLTAALDGKSNGPVDGTEDLAPVGTPDATPETLQTPEAAR